MKISRMCKWFLLLLVVFMEVSIFACPNANEEIAFQKCEKTYVSEDQIQLQQGQIFVNQGESWFLTNSLLADAEGLYFDVIAYAAGCPSPYIQCRNRRCGKCVHQSYEKCPHCGWSLH